MTVSDTRIPTERLVPPTVRVVFDLGPRATLNDLAEGLADLNAMVDVATDLSGIVRFSSSLDPLLDVTQVRSPYGQMLLRPDRFPLGGQPLKPETSGAVFEDFFVQITPRPGGEPRTSVRLVRRSESARVKYLSYSNPIDSWLELLAGSGALGAALLLGRFLRDFGADRRLRKAEADLAEERAAQARQQTRVDTATADTIVEIMDGIKQTFTEALGPYSQRATDVIDGLVTIDQLQAMARLAQGIRVIEDVTDSMPPQLGPGDTES